MTEVKVNTTELLVMEKTTFSAPSWMKTKLLVSAAQERVHVSDLVLKAVKVYLYLNENHPDELAAVLADIEAQSTESEAA